MRTALDPSAVQAYLDGPHKEIRDQVRELLSDESLARGPAPPPTAEYRERVLDWARALAASGGAGLGFPEEFGGTTQGSPSTSSTTARTT